MELHRMAGEMKQERYNRYKIIFENNYANLEKGYLGLNIPIDLLMVGVKKDKELFFKLYSHDTGCRGTMIVSSLDKFKRYKTMLGNPMSRLSKPTGKNMFRLYGEYERVLNYIQKKP